jgi:hypothetical protein
MAIDSSQRAKTQRGGPWGGSALKARGETNQRFRLIALLDAILAKAPRGRQPLRCSRLLIWHPR